MIPDSVGCGRRLYRRVQPLVRQAAQVEAGKPDRYRKHFMAVSHIWVLILHLAQGGHSLRQSHSRLGANPTVRRRLGLPPSKWVSLSQLARSSTSRGAECFEDLLEQLTHLVKRTPQLGKDADWQVLNKTKALDSTFLRLSAKLSPWSKRGRSEAGVRVQWALELAPKIPQVLHMHTVQQNDHDALQALVEQDPTPFVGWTLIMDLGYYGHRQFERLLAAGVHVLTKLHPQAAYHVTECRAVAHRRDWRQKEHDEVLTDETITLGSPNNRRGAVLPNMRLVTSRNPKGEVCRLLTDRFDLAAWEVVELYRRRWQIELFFRWLKRQLGGARPLGQSREAVWLTVLVGAIVALIWLLLDEMGLRPSSMSRISWLGAVSVGLKLAINLSG